MSMLTQGMSFRISPDGTNFTEIGCISGFNWDQPERAQIDTTCFSSDSKEFSFGLRDNGTVSLEYRFDVSSNGQELLEESYASEDSYSFEIEYSDNAGTTGTVKKFVGYVTSLSQDGSLDDIINGSCTIKLTGDVTTVDPTP